MKLFAFGLGYSALHYLARHRDAYDEAAGTIRTAERVEPLREAGLTVHIFGPEKTDPAIADRVAEADVLLVSVPPGTSVDPVLAQFGRSISNARRSQKIIYLSTVGVYGDRNGDWVDEDLPPTPKTQRSMARVQAERAWTAFGKDKTKTVHILRLAGIYGEGRNALLNLKAGTARRLVKKEQVFNRIHVEDVARAIEAALAFDGPGSIWNVSDDEPAPPQDVITFAASLMGIAPPPEQDVETAEMSPMARSFYDENKRASNRKLKQELGVTLAYPSYREGLTALWEAGEGR
jgi:nucleoside-diphosphate-sugar epimerase